MLLQRGQNGNNKGKRNGSTHENLISGYQDDDDNWITDGDGIQTKSSVVILGKISLMIIIEGNKVFLCVWKSIWSLYMCVYIYLSWKYLLFLINNRHCLTFLIKILFDINHHYLIYNLISVINNADINFILYRINILKDNHNLNYWSVMN